MESLHPSVSQSGHLPGFCQGDISSATQPFVTKLGMAVCYHVVVSGAKISLLTSKFKWFAVFKVKVTTCAYITKKYGCVCYIFLTADLHPNLN